MNKYNLLFYNFKIKKKNYHKPNKGLINFDVKKYFVEIWVYDAFENVKIKYFKLLVLRL